VGIAADIPEFVGCVMGLKVIHAFAFILGYIVIIIEFL
jgi:hypothetical protein